MLTPFNAYLICVFFQFYCTGQVCVNGDECYDTTGALWKSNKLTVKFEVLLGLITLLSVNLYINILEKAYFYIL